MSYSKTGNTMMQTTHKSPSMKGHMSKTHVSAQENQSKQSERKTQSENEQACLAEPMSQTRTNQNEQVRQARPVKYGPYGQKRQAEKGRQVRQARLDK